MNQCWHSSQAIKVFLLTFLAFLWILEMQVTLTLQKFQRWKATEEGINIDDIIKGSLRATIEEMQFLSLRDIPCTFIAIGLKLPVAIWKYTGETPLKTCCVGRVLAIRESVLARFESFCSHEGLSSWIYLCSNCSGPKKARKMQRCFDIVAV